MGEKLSPGDGGFVSYSSDAIDATVRVDQAEDGRLEIRELHLVLEDEVLTTDMLRAVPLGKVEAWCNAEPLRSMILRTLATRVDAWEPPVKPRRKGGAMAPIPGRSDPLEVPTGGRYPDSFYRSVAKQYERLVAAGNRSPAMQLASVNGVPVSTAHRWVKEARARGFLAPGRKGKAG